MIDNFFTVVNFSISYFKKNIFKYIYEILNKYKECMI